MHVSPQTRVLCYSTTVTTSTGSGSITEAQNSPLENHSSVAQLQKQRREKEGAGRENDSKGEERA